MSVRQPAVLPWKHGGKESICQCRRCKFSPWVRKIPWRRRWQPTPVFLPGNSHGWRSLAGYSPWGRKKVGDKLVTKQQQTTSNNSEGLSFSIRGDTSEFVGCFAGQYTSYILVQNGYSNRENHL